MKVIWTVLFICIFFISRLFAEPFSGMSAFDFSNVPPAPLNRIDLSVTVAPDRVKPGSSFRLHLQVVITAGSHIYSLDEQLEGSLASRIELKSSNLLPRGDWEEPPPQMTMDEVFQTVVKTHAGIAEFSREYQIPLTAKPGEISIDGAFIYRVCNNKTCSMPLSLDFQFPLQIIQGEPVRN